MPGCKSSLPTRTRLWHGPLVEIWLMLATLRSDKQSDVAVLGALRNIIMDVRTVVGADPRYCAAAALFPGHRAVWGAARKNGPCLSHTLPQDYAFFALCREAGGHMGDPAHDFA